MSYSIDVYRGDTRAMRSINDYFCFVAMFHQLVAGPIVRFSEVADQLKNRSHTLDKFARGVALFSLGLAMKVLLANPNGKIADTIFNAGSVNTLDAWYGTLAYAFQIYFDFAGYSEMAVGLGLMMGFVFAQNFDQPYRAASLTEFWRRWHISLLDVAARLPVHPAGRQPQRPGPHLRQLSPGHAARRPVARRVVELRDLGRPPRRRSGLGALARRASAP
jgi:D-alanyl-lipoteichoic acid acyltransferase DltB (MBOAT superfamily)